MVAGTWAATAASSVIVAASNNRDILILQLHSGDVTALAVGEAAVFAKGVKLYSVGDTVTLTGWMARQAIYGICDTALTAAGGYQEG